MEVQHDARAGLARRGERAPAERRVDVVGVDDAGAGAPDRLAHLLGARARRAAAPRRPGAGRASDESRSSTSTSSAEMLADQPREVLDGALLATGHAVAVVQQQDHVRGAAYAAGRSTDSVSISLTSPIVQVGDTRCVGIVERHGGDDDMAESTTKRAPAPVAGSHDAITLVVLGLAATTRPRGDGDPGAHDLRRPARPGLRARPPRAGAWTPRERARRPTTGCAATRPGRTAQGISGACGRRYKVRMADEGHTLRVRLTATESDGQAASADSAPTARRAARSRTSSRTVGETDTCTKVTPTGPGQGTFTSGTQTGGGSEPSAGHLARRSSTRSPCPHRRPLQGQAHDAHARHGQGAARHAHPDPLQGPRLPVQAQGGRRRSSSASARCSARTARRRRSRSGSRSRRRSASTRGSARAGARRRCASTAA